jgi:hypothetical protein
MIYVVDFDIKAIFRRNKMVGSSTAFGTETLKNGAAAQHTNCMRFSLGSKKKALIKRAGQTQCSNSGSATATDTHAGVPTWS